MSYTLPQLMVTAAAREIDDGEVVFCWPKAPTQKMPWVFMSWALCAIPLHPNRS